MRETEFKEQTQNPCNHFYQRFYYLKKIFSRLRLPHNVCLDHNLKRDNS